METEKIAQVDPSSTSIDSLLNDKEDQQNGIGLFESLIVTIDRDNILIDRY